MSRSDDEAKGLGARQDDERGGAPWKASAEFLRRGLVLGDGFALYVVAAEQLDTRETLLRSLSEDPALVLARVDVAELDDAAIDRPIEAAQRELDPGDRRPVVVVSGLEELAERVPELMVRLNEYRNELRARIAGAMVWLGTPTLLRLVQHQAPDVWSARAADLELDEAPPAWRPPPLQPQAGDSITKDVSRWQHELEELPPGERRGRLALWIADALEREGSNESRARTLYEQAANELKDPAVRALALAHVAILDGSKTDDGSMAAAVAAVHALDEATLAPERIAYAWTALASAWRARGHLDHAERATSHALRLAKRSGHGEVCADALAELAEQLTMRGRLSEASACWHEVLALPQSSFARLDALVRAGTTAAMAGRRDWLGRHWRNYLVEGGRRRQLEDEVEPMDEHAAALARETLATIDSPCATR